MTNLGVEVSEMDLDKRMKEFDKDHNGIVQFSEFVYLMKDVLVDLEDDRLKNAWKIFLIFKLIYKEIKWGIRNIWPGRKWLHRCWRVGLHHEQTRSESQYWASEGWQIKYYPWSMTLNTSSAYLRVKLIYQRFYQINLFLLFENICILGQYEKKGLYRPGYTQGSSSKWSPNKFYSFTSGLDLDIELDILNSGDGQVCGFRQGWENIIRWIQETYVGPLLKRKVQINTNDSYI